MTVKKKTRPKKAKSTIKESTLKVVATLVGLCVSFLAHCLFLKKKDHVKTTYPPNDLLLPEQRRNGTAQLGPQIKNFNEIFRGGLINPVEQQRTLVSELFLALYDMVLFCYVVPWPVVAASCPTSAHAVTLCPDPRPKNTTLTSPKGPTSRKERCMSLLPLPSMWYASVPSHTNPRLTTPSLPPTDPTTIKHLALPSPGPPPEGP